MSRVFYNNDTFVMGISDAHELGLAHHTALRLSFELDVTQGQSLPIDAGIGIIHHGSPSLASFAQVYGARDLSEPGASLGLVSFGGQRNLGVHLGFDAGFPQLPRRAALSAGWPWLR